MATLVFYWALCFALSSELGALHAQTELHFIYKAEIMQVKKLRFGMIP